MKIAIDCDDAGLVLKKVLIEHLQALGTQVEDLDLLASMKVDYPDIGYNLAKRVASKAYDRGILICGTGLGMAMIANKVPGVFAGTCSSPSNNPSTLFDGFMCGGFRWARSAPSDCLCAM